MLSTEIQILPLRKSGKQSTEIHVLINQDQQEMLMPPGDIGEKSMHTNPPSPNTPLPPAPVPNGMKSPSNLSPNQIKSKTSLDTTNDHIDDSDL